MVCSRWPEPRKSKKKNKNCRPHVHRVRQEPQWGLQFFFFFLDFRGFCMVCSRWPEPRKSKKAKKNKTADHMSTESDKSPNGVCSFFFLIFEVCASPMGSAVLFFCFFKNVFEVFASPMGSAVLFFWVFRGFCMVCFAVYYCCYHIKLPFTLRNPCRTLQNLAKSKLSHLPPPHPPLSSFNSCFRGSMALAPQSMSFR